MWSKSKLCLVLIELLVKGGLVCLAIWQTIQEKCVLIFKVIGKLLIFFIAWKGKCPNRLCHKIAESEIVKAEPILFITSLDN